MAESTPSGRGLLEGMVCPGNGMELGDAGASKVVRLLRLDRMTAKGEEWLEFWGHSREIGSGS